MNFIETFDENYSYFLKEIQYRVITVGNIQGKIDIMIGDSLTFNMLDDSHLEIIVERNVKFEPNVVYELSVSFGAVLKLKENIRLSIDSNWKNDFINSPEGNTIIQSLLSRVSLQIAQITSSCGPNPIVTSPNLMDKV